MLLISSSDTDMTYERPDGTQYVLEIRKDKDDYYYIPEHQLNLDLGVDCGKKPYAWDMREKIPQPPMDSSKPWTHNK